MATDTFKIKSSLNWSKIDFNLRTFHHFVEGIPFTQKSWRGRIRASKWIGAALPQDLIEEFDNELEILLSRNYPENFEIPHDIRIQIFELKE